MRNTLVAQGLLLLLLFTVTASSGQAIIRGRVQDSTVKPLDGATVRLYKDSVAIRQTRAGQNGFVLGKTGPGHYFLRVSYSGYKDSRQSLVIKTGDTLINLAPIVLSFGSDNNLMEVVVKATIPPVMLKKDTVVYNASAYKLRPNATIEELLKKLPGITVDKDGSVSLQGKKIEKIYIDGKEFMVNDPKIVTQGFNADMLAAVEAFDNNSDDARFMGIRDMNAGGALNFRLKKEYRKSLQGKAFAGIGQEPSRYTGGIKLDRFQPESLTSLSAATNSINDLYQGFDMPVSSIPVGNNRHAQESINYTDKQFVLGYSGRSETQSQINQREKRTFLTDSSLYQTANSTGDNDNVLHSLDFRYRLKLDSLTSLDISPSFSYSTTQNHSRDSSNQYAEGQGFQHSLSEAVSENSGNNQNISGNARMAVRHRFHKKGQYLVVNLTANSARSKMENRIVNRLTTPSFLQKLDQFSQSETPVSGWSASISYSQPVAKGKVIDLNYGLTRSVRSSNKLSYNYNPATGLYDLIDTLTTSRFTSLGLQQRFAAGYNAVSKKMRYQLGVAAQLNQLDNQVTQGIGSSFSQNVVNWYPRASLQYQVQKNENLELNYSGQATQPTIQQLQPLPDLRNPLLIKTGNPDLKPQFDHTLSFHFNRFAPQKNSGLLLGLNLHISSLKLVQSVKNLPGGVQEIRYENVNGNYDLSANISSTIGLGQDGRIKLGTALHIGEDPSYLNGSLVTRKMRGIRPDFLAGYSPIERLDLEVDGLVDISRIDYSTGQSGLAQLSQRYSFSARYELPGGWQFSGDFHYQQQVAGSGLPLQDSRLLNASLIKSLGKDRHMEIRLSCYDLLATANGISQTVSDQSIETGRMMVPQRLFLISAVWRFKKTLAHASQNP